MELDNGKTLLVLAIRLWTHKTRRVN